MCGDIKTLLLIQTLSIVSKYSFFQPFAVSGYGRPPFDVGGGVILHVNNKVMFIFWSRMAKYDMQFTARQRAELRLIGSGVVLLNDT